MDGQISLSDCRSRLALAHARPAQERRAPTGINHPFWLDESEKVLKNLNAIHERAARPFFVETAGREGKWYLCAGARARCMDWTCLIISKARLSCLIFPVLLPPGPHLSHRSSSRSLQMWETSGLEHFCP